ncbi:MAG TPA: cytochrome-c peroxidase [Candidatus Margulisiibacteriota bacterium]|nr:cytochrome-c peroxidase [Candidatus Margulisiibacteriota bacterium]
MAQTQSVERHAMAYGRPVPMRLLVGVLILLSACGDAGSQHAASTPPSDEASLTPAALLGKRLFEDTNLSEPPGQACASCHDSQHAFTGNNGSRIPAVALGSRPETFGNRNTPTVMYALFSPGFSFVAAPDEDGLIDYTPTGGQFWDGRATSLAEQAMQPFLNSREMNNPNPAAVIAKVRDSSYAALFRSVYGSNALDDVDTAYDQLVDAIAAFESTPRFHPFSSKFDDYLRGTATLDPAEARGFELFKDPEKGNCIACHVGDESSRDPAAWLFTDFTYDNLGIPRNTKIPDNNDPTFFDLGLCKQEGIAAKAPPGFDVESLCGAFKVPTLRNVAVTAPYGHNGYFTTLRDVVRFYVTRDTNPELWYPTDAAGNVQKFNDLPPEYRANVNTEEVPYDRKPGEQPRLADDEIDAVVAFLNTLTDR